MNDPQNQSTQARRLEAARKAVTDEAGSRLCSWIDLGTERVCTKDAGRILCLCEKVARVAVAAADGVETS